MLRDENNIIYGESWYALEVLETKKEQVPDLTGFRVNTTFIATFTNETDINSLKADVSILDILEDNAEIDETTNTLISGKISTKKLTEKLGDVSNWYDYSTQKWANIVVRNAGSEAYYTWIPRYIYKLDNKSQISEILFIDVDDLVPEGWTLPEAFTWWGKDNNPVQLSGFWTSKYNLTGKTDFNVTAVVYGMANKIQINSVKGSSIASAKYKLYLYEEEEYNKFKTATVEPEKAPGDKINNENNYDCSDNRYVRYSELTENQNVTYTGLNPGNYVLRIAVYDTRGYYRGEKWYTGINVQETKQAQAPDLTGFRVNTTFVATFTNETDINSVKADVSILDILDDNAVIDETTNTLISGKISEEKVAEKIGDISNWYDYNSQKWANIVVRNAGSEAYYTWIPRYIYKLDNELQISEILFIDVNEPVPEGWTLPEAFTWWDKDNNPVQLSGFWTSKYNLTGKTNFNITSAIYGMVNRIEINDIKGSSITNATYKLYLYEEEEYNKFKTATVEPEKAPGDKINNENNYDCSNNRYVRYSQGTESELTRITYTGLNPGNYVLRVAVYDTRGYYRGEKWFTDITVIPKVDSDIISNDNADANTIIFPDFTGFRVDTTYLVTYSDVNDLNSETQNIPISEILEDGANINASTHTLISGNVDKEKVKAKLGSVSNWYDYDNQKWANILVSNNNKKAYFTWIPRYIYKLDNERQTSEVKFIKVDDNIPDGWILPEAFTWGDKDDKLVQLSGFWTSKYNLTS